MALTRQVEELVLLKCSLLPDEILEFIFSNPDDMDTWMQVVNAHSEGDNLSSRLTCPARFAVKSSATPLWFEIDFPTDYPRESSNFNVTIRGYDLSRAEQQRWQDIVLDKRAQLKDAEFPAYELISLHLLPMLHDEYDSRKTSIAGQQTTSEAPKLKEPVFHALLTSHHLKSFHKRRSLQQWSSELCLTGFAKVGYPGVIYCSGAKRDVEEFVSRVKDMQWLALRVRFVEDLPEVAPQQSGRGSWVEVEKVGEVIEEMRKLGRENYALELGIGSAGAK